MAGLLHVVGLRQDRALQDAVSFWHPYAHWNRNLIALANSRGARDNVTALVLRAEDRPSA